MERLEIDIWSDVMCPWCAIGYTQFARAVEQLAGEIAVETRWMPFELSPETPPEGKPLARHLAEVYGRSEVEVEAMRAQMLAEAERAGFPMAYAGPTEAGAPLPEPMMWNTFEAHKLLCWALAAWGAEAQARLGLALMRAHFQQRLNVADRAVLLDLAASEGLDRAAAAEALDDEALAIAVRLEQRRGREAGIAAVPTFVVGGRFAVPGARAPAEFADMLRRAAPLLQRS